MIEKTKVFKRTGWTNEEVGHLARGEKLIEAEIPMTAQDVYNKGWNAALEHFAIQMVVHFDGDPKALGSFAFDPDLKKVFSIVDPPDLKVV